MIKRKQFSLRQMDHIVGLKRRSDDFEFSYVGTFDDTKIRIMIVKKDGRALEIFPSGNYEFIDLQSEKHGLDKAFSVLVRTKASGKANQEILGRLIFDLDGNPLGEIK